jgi:DNA-binding transcriptional ArsR family regulator
MVKYDRELDFTFNALADPTRRAILASLVMGRASVSQLAEPHKMSLPAVMKHLTVLERAGLIRQEKEGRVRQCRLVFHPLKQANDWIAQYRSFWEAQFDSLGRYLQSNSRTTDSPSAAESAEFLFPSTLGTAACALTEEQNKESLECPHPKSQQEHLNSAERLPRRAKGSSGLGRKRKS